MHSVSSAAAGTLGAAYAAHMVAELARKGGMATSAYGSQTSALVAAFTGAHSRVSKRRM